VALSDWSELSYNASKTHWAVITGSELYAGGGDFFETTCVLPTASESEKNYLFVKTSSSGGFTTLQDGEIRGFAKRSSYESGIWLFGRRDATSGNCYAAMFGAQAATVTGLYRGALVPGINNPETLLEAFTPPNYTTVREYRLRIENISENPSISVDWRDVGASSWTNLITYVDSSVDKITTAGYWGFGQHPEGYSDGDHKLNFDTIVIANKI
jgi:hypothetical protein